jgi:hypothetical protein
MPISLGLAIGGQGKPTDYAGLYAAKEKGKQDAINRKAAQDQKQVDMTMMNAQRMMNNKNRLAFDEAEVERAYHELVTAATEEVGNDQINRTRIYNASQKLSNEVNRANENFNAFTNATKKTSTENGIMDIDREILSEESTIEGAQKRLAEEGFGGFSIDPKTKRVSANSFGYVSTGNALQNFLKDNKDAIYNEPDKGKGYTINGTDVVFYGIKPEAQDAFLSIMDTPDGYRSARYDFYATNPDVKRMKEGSPEEREEIRKSLSSKFETTAKQLYAKDNIRGKTVFNTTVNNNTNNQLENPNAINEETQVISAYGGMMDDGKVTTYGSYGMIGENSVITDMPKGTRNFDTGQEITTSGGTFKSGVVKIFPVVKNTAAFGNKGWIDGIVYNNGKQEKIKIYPNMVIPDGYMEQAFMGDMVEFKPMVLGQFTPTGGNSTGAVNVVMPISTTVNATYIKQTKEGKALMNKGLNDLNDRVVKLNALGEKVKEEAMKNGTTVIEWIKHGGNNEIDKTDDNSTVNKSQIKGLLDAANADLKSKNKPEMTMDAFLAKFKEKGIKINPDK